MDLRHVGRNEDLSADSLPVSLVKVVSYFPQRAELGGLNHAMTGQNNFKMECSFDPLEKGYVSTFCLGFLFLLLFFFFVCFGFFAV